MRVLAVVPTLARDVPRLNGAIRSLREHSRAHPFDILVVNNSGRPDIPGLDPVDYVFSPGINLGYVGALEFARRTYPSDFLWSIQDDMTLDNDVLDRLLAAMTASPRLAVVSPVLVRNSVVPARTRAGTFSNPQRTRWENYPAADTPPENLPRDMDYSFVSGSGALFRSAALVEINGFNLDLYPLVLVDVDVCARLLAKNWQITLEPRAQIQHEIKGSTSRLLALTLDRLNRPIVEGHMDTRETSVQPQFDPVDADLLFHVARRASFLFLAVSEDAESRLTEIEQSTSWKVSAPLRLIRNSLRPRRGG